MESEHSESDMEPVVIVRPNVFIEAYSQKRHTSNNAMKMSWYSYIYINKEMINIYILVSEYMVYIYHIDITLPGAGVGFGSPPVKTNEIYINIRKHTPLHS